MLVPRRPYAFTSPVRTARGAGQTPPWERALAGLDQEFLTDNQLSAWVSRDHAGLSALHFYPLPFPHAFASGKWDYAELADHDALRGAGPMVALPAAKASLRFRPHLIEKRVRLRGGGTIDERCSVAGSVALLDWRTQGVARLPIELTLPHFAARFRVVTPSGEKGAPWCVVVAVRDQLYLALAITGLAACATATLASPGDATASGFGLSLEGAPQRGGRVRLAMAVAYRRQEALAAARAAAVQPEAFIRRAARTWNDYFKDVVPRLTCSHRRLERLYYYQAYVTRCNLYDIPYEPFTQPYTCPWKTGAVWQWSWNTPLDSVAERWLNDKRLGAGGILLEAANGGALNMGTYLHPLERQTALRDHHEALLAMADNQQALRPDYRLEACSTLPHTTPNGLLGAWELYLVARDPEQLRAFLPLMVEAEALFSARELPCGLHTTYFVDEFDYSLRWRPFTRDFGKGDAQNMFRMTTPVVAIDYNCYLFALRNCILQAAAILGDATPPELDAQEMAARNSRLREAINHWLWDEEDGFYYDAHPETLSRSGVRCIGAYSALYAGIASQRQAERLVEHLQDPGQFGTPYPCPSISMDTPGVDPAVITYGGDSLVTSGIWFTVVGLARYGFRQLAAQYVARTIDMLSAGGPTSSYSYHSATGAPNMPRHQLTAQSCIVTDLICRYVVGFEPAAQGFRLDPLALSALGIRRLAFGPFRYGRQTVTVEYDATAGMKVEVRDDPVGPGRGRGKRRTQPSL